MLSAKKPMIGKSKKRRPFKESPGRCDPDRALFPKSPGKAPAESGFSAIDRDGSLR